MTTARPILFSAPMIRALLDGRKTQTRRVAKFAPHPDAPNVNLAFSGLEAGTYSTGQPASGWVLRSRGAMGCWNDRTKPLRCPYGSPGDLLWVRETCCAVELPDGRDGVRYTANNEWLAIQNTAEAADCWVELNHYRGKRGQPVNSIHMPRWASRLTLELTDIRIERLQNISEADAIAEGASSRPNCSGFRAGYDGWSMDWSQVGQPSRIYKSDETLTEHDISLTSAKTAFGSYWNEVHGGPHWNLKPESEEPWELNPWVWVLVFRVHAANVDTVLAERTKTTEAA